MQINSESSNNSTWFSMSSTVNPTQSQNFFLIDLEQYKNQLQSKAQAPEDKTKYNLIVVLDCSGSMSGGRIRLATGILKDLMENPLVDSMTIIKFGTNVEAPRHFTKKNSNQILSIRADCGGTNFRPAITKLMEVIKSPNNSNGFLQKITSLLRSTPKDKDSKMTAIFFSDGQAGTPSEMYAPLKKVLTAHNCPLLSVAVTTNAQPELMINLSQLYGNLELVLLQDNDDKANGLALIEDKLCLGLELFDAVLVTKSGDKVNKKKVVFREGQEKLFANFESKGSLGEGEIQFALVLKNNEKVPLKGTASNIQSLGSVDTRLGRLSEITGFLMKESISKVAQNSISKEEGLGFVKGLRQMVLACSIEENYFKEIERLRTDKSDSERLQEILKRQKDLKTNTLELQTNVNKLEDLITGGDLRAALETYSAKTVSNKVNRRAMKIAQKNAEKNLPSSIQGWVIQRILDSAPDASDKELPECILWCINHLQAGIEIWQASPNDPLDVSGLDWVGRGCLVNPGKTASLNAWGLNSVQIRPVNISNNSVSYVKVSDSDNGRRLAHIKGVNIGEFNCAVPFVHPDEDVRMHRVALAMIKGTHEGTRAFSNLFCGSPDLFAIEQVFAMYSVATVSTLMKADKTVHFEDSARAILSLWDLAFFSQKDTDKASFCVKQGANASDDYVKENITRLAANPLEFIAQKDDVNMSDYLRLFYLLMVGDAHLREALPGKSLREFLSEIKYYLFLRKMLDLTSNRFLLDKFLGFKKTEYREEVMQCIEAQREMEGLVGEFALDAEFKFLDVRRMSKAEDLLLVLDDFRRAKDCASFRELHCRLLQKQIPFAEFAEELKKTGHESATQDERLQRFFQVTPELLASLKVAEHPRIKMDYSIDFKSLLTRALIVCVQKHTVDGNFPRHGSTYNKATLGSFGTWADLCSDKFNAILLKQLKGVESQALGELGDAKRKLLKIKKLVARVENFEKVCPFERMFWPYQESQLSFSGDDVPTFENKQKMFSFLFLSSYGPEIMSVLKNCNLGNVMDVDPEKLIKKDSQYLHGVSLYADQNLSKSSSAEDFKKLMMKDMETHYQNKNQENAAQYVFGSIRRNRLSRVCEHIFLEQRILEELKKSDKTDETEIFQHILQAFPGCLTQNYYNEEIRKEHLQWLIKKKLQKAFPFN